MYKLGDKQHDKEILAYAVHLYLNPFVIIVLSLTISLLLHAFIHTFIGLLALMVLKRYTIGHHLRSSDLCVLLSVSLILSVPLLAYILSPYVLFLNLFTLLLIRDLTPFKKQDAYTDRKRRNIATTLVILNICFPISNFVSIAFFLVSLDIINYGSVFKWVTSLISQDTVSSAG